MGAGAGTAASGAASGAATGSIVGPWGTAIGAGVGAGLSLMQASGQASAQREAERQAEIATRMRIQQQEQNFFEAMQVPTEAYDRALREGTAQQAQVLASLQEGDPRQLLGGVGKVQAVSSDYNAQNRDAMAQQMFELSKLQAQEKMLNADDLSKIYGERAEGAQKAAASAELAKIAAINSAITGATDIVTRIDAGRNEYKPQMAISNTGANISGVTGTGVNLVDTKSQSPVGSMFADKNTGFNFPSYSVSSPENIGSNFMSSTPTFNPYVSAGYNKKPTVDIFGNIIR